MVGKSSGMVGVNEGGLVEIVVGALGHELEKKGEEERKKERKMNEVGPFPLRHGRDCPLWRVKAGAGAWGLDPLKAV